MKKIALGLVVAAAVVFAFAATPPASAPKAAKGDCCAKEAKVSAKTADDCKGGVCPMEAHAVKAEAKTDACAMGSGNCPMEGGKHMTKGKAGCCNAPGQLAKFKVFVDGKWMFYGCKEMASKGRQELLTMAFKVGQVLPVSGKVQIPTNQSLL